MFSAPEDPAPSPAQLQVHTTEWPGGAIRGQLHWAASSGNDVLSVYNDLSGAGGSTSGAACGAPGLLALMAAAVLAFML